MAPLSLLRAQQLSPTLVQQAWMRLIRTVLELGLSAILEAMIVRPLWLEEILTVSDQLLENCCLSAATHFLEVERPKASAKAGWSG